MYCRECGAEMAEGARFCPQCGTQVIEEQHKAQTRKAQTNWIALVSAFDSSTGEARDEAFARLYEASYDAVYAHVYRYARNEDVTSDVVQNAYITCWNRIDQLQNAGNFLPWMKRIAYNAFIDNVRKDAHEQVYGTITDDEGNETNQEAFLADDTLPMPEDAYANEELRQLLMNAINELSSVQRVVIKRFYYDNMSVQAIADELDVPTGTVKTHLSRGRKAIGQRVQSYANAYGLKLAPLALIPLLASLAKEDVYACERVAATAGGATWAAVQAITGAVSTGTGSSAAGAAGVGGAASASAGTGAAGASAGVGTGAGAAATGVGTAAGTSTAAAGAGAAGATTATSGAAAGAAGTGLAVKVGIGVTALAVAAGGTGAYVYTRNADQQEVVEESAPVATTEVEDEPIAIQEEPAEQSTSTEILYQYVTDNMEIAQEADLQGGYRVEPIGDPANPSWYALVNGNYQADDGVYAVMQQDLDLDGDEELLVLSRSYEEAVADDPDALGGWQLTMQVVDMNDGAVIVSDPQTILSMGESGNGSIGPDERSFAIYYKDLGDSIEVLCRSRTVHKFNVDGESDEVVGYRYQDGQLEMAGRASWGGSDVWGIGEDEELLGSLRELGLETTAASLAKYTSSYEWSQGDVYEGMLSSAEEGITEVLHMKTVSNLDEEAWWAVSGSDDPTAFDASAYSISLELYIDDADNMLYSSSMN